LYFEENDLCRRVKKSGKKIVFFPEAEFIHFGGKSTVDPVQAEEYFRQSRDRFLKKHYGALVGGLTGGVIKFLEFLSQIFK
jgi:GT2 family glycosyltransferase